MSEKLNISMYQQGNYYRIPKILIQGEKYSDLSSDAKLLYSVYQDRAELSIKNDWIDKNGDLFFLFSIDEICFFMGWGNKKAIKVKKELTTFDLLSEVRQGLNQPNKTYLHLVDAHTLVRKFISKGRLLFCIDKFSSKNSTARDELEESMYLQNCLNDLSEQLDVSPQVVDSFLKGYKINLKSCLYQIEETSEECSDDGEVSKRHFQENPVISRKCHNDISGNVESTLLEVSESHPNHTEYSDTENNDIEKREDEEIDKEKSKESSLREYPREKDQNLSAEYDRLLDENPRLLKFVSAFDDEAYFSMEQRMSLLRAVDDCFYMLQFELDSGNKDIEVQLRFYGEPAFEQIISEVFDKQMTYTKENCMTQKYFIQYFVNGLKERMENRIRNFQSVSK